MITPTSSNEDLDEFDPRVFILIGQSLSNKDYQDNANFETEKVEKTKELENIIEMSTQITNKIKENERLLEIEKGKFKLFSSEKKLNKIIAEDIKIYNELFAKISALHEDILNIDKLIDKTKSFL